MIKFFLFSLYNAYQSSQSFLMALAIALSICVFYYLGRLIWRSKYHILSKLSLILVLSCLIASAFYVSVREISYYKAKKQVQKLFSEEFVLDLKVSYQIRKEFDIEKELKEFIERVKKCTNDGDNVYKQLRSELININNLLENPFIVNEYDIERALSLIRIPIVELLEECWSNDQEALKNIKKAEKIHHILNEGAKDPYRFEIYKLLVTKEQIDPREVIKVFEQFMRTKEGRDKIKRSTSLVALEAQLLDIFIDDADIFKNLVENSLLKLTQHVSLEKQQYIEKYFSSLYSTFEGREKIIQDIHKLIKMLNMRIEVICNIAEEKGFASFDDLGEEAEKQIGCELDKILQTIGN